MNHSPVVIDTQIICVNLAKYGVLSPSGEGGHGMRLALPWFSVIFQYPRMKVDAVGTLKGGIA